VTISESILPELEHESRLTRQMLERVPEDKFDWKPAEKSMTLRQLTSHMSMLPGWGLMTLTTDELDIDPPGGEPYVPPQLNSLGEILDHFDAELAKLRDAIASTDDATFMKPWTFKAGGEEVFTLPKIGVIRSTILNHLIHHRGQLSVYLRLNDVPLPMTYGPSADETGEP
jgi:uncharacterized damage-inducible protein DinB